MDLDAQQQLVSDAQQSPEGFGKLYDYYFPKIYNFVASRIRNRDDAEDVTGDVFMKVLENIHRFEWRGVPFTAWIFTIARNELNTYYRNHSRTSTQDIEKVYGLSEDEEKTSPHIKAAQSELADEVKKVMKDLPEKELTVVQLKFFSQLNNREIMHVTGLSESHVGVILYRTLRKIKPQLTYFA